jgi:hypothetical protein
MAAVAMAACLAQGAGAATLYDFDWSGGASFSASGTMELGSAIGIGDPFGSDDVLALDVELFDGATSVGTIDYASFQQGGDTLEGTRNASSLSILDLYLTSFGVTLGCEAVGCLFGGVQFFTPSTPGAVVEFGSTEAARASFVFTQVPEPGVEWSLVLALLAIAGMRFAGAIASAARRPRRGKRNA